MSDNQVDEAARQDIISSGYAIAASLQKTGTPIRTIQILSVAVGMTLCASVKKRDDVKDVMDTFVKQINQWCDFEEEEKTASWLNVN
jgi:hypothetical protein